MVQAEASRIISVEAGVSLGGSQMTQTEMGCPGKDPVPPASLIVPRSRSPWKQGAAPGSHQHAALPVFQWVLDNPILSGHISPAQSNSLPAKGLR